MSDDIVFRLRNCWCGYCRDGVDGCIKREASDEIERLRKNFNHWYKTAWLVGEMLAEKTGEDVAEMMDNIDYMVEDSE